MMEQIKAFLDTAGGQIAASGISIGALGGLATNIIATVQAKREAKKNGKLVLENKAKDEIIKAKEEEIAFFKKQFLDVKTMVTAQAQMTATSFMDSGVSVQTKEELLKQVEVIKTTGATLEVKFDESKAEAIAKVSEVGQTLKTTVDTTITKAKEIGADMMEIYNKIANPTAPKV